MKINIKSLDLKSKTSTELIQIGEKHNQLNVWVAILKTQMLSNESIVEILLTQRKKYSTEKYENILIAGLNSLSSVKKVLLPKILKAIGSEHDYLYNFLFKAKGITIEQKIAMAKSVERLGIWLDLIRHIEGKLRNKDLKKLVWFGKNYSFLKFPGINLLELFQKIFTHHNILKFKKMVYLKQLFKNISWPSGDYNKKNFVKDKIDERISEYINSNNFDKFSIKEIMNYWQITDNKVFLNLAKVRSMTEKTINLIEFAKEVNSPIIWRELLRLKKLKWEEL